MTPGSMGRGRLDRRAVQVESRAAAAPRIRRAAAAKAQAMRCMVSSSSRLAGAAFSSLSRRALESGPGSPGKAPSHREALHSARGALAVSRPERCNGSTGRRHGRGHTPRPRHPRPALSLEAARGPKPCCSPAWCSVRGPSPARGTGLPRYGSGHARHGRHQPAPDRGGASHASRSSSRSTNHRGGARSPTAIRGLPGHRLRRHDRRGDGRLRDSVRRRRRLVPAHRGLRSRRRLRVRLPVRARRRRPTRRASFYYARRPRLRRARPPARARRARARPSCGLFPRESRSPLRSRASTPRSRPSVRPDPGAALLLDYRRAPPSPRGGEQPRAGASMPAVRPPPAPGAA